MTLVLAAGTTRTAAIEGLSAAGADPTVRLHTPSADAEILTHGRPAESDVIPISPTGCPTPAVVTRAVRELAPFQLTVLDAGLVAPLSPDPVAVGAEPGADIRQPLAVPDARRIARRARDVAKSQACTDSLALAETIPGGTTTAMGVLRALGEPDSVSSSMADNPLERKRNVVDRALAASELSEGEAAGDPLQAIQAVGDPVQAVLFGYAKGALEADIDLVLAGGTQLLAVAACLRHDNVTADLRLHTTSFLADDPTAEVDRLAGKLNVDISVTDPGFDQLEHPAAAAYCRGEAKEGVGMGWALGHLARSRVPMDTLRRRFISLTDTLLTAQTASSQ
ncbi:MAG: nicotinate-nucleotide--dimethylbenzimidazole phosphoribosyltransferase [Salinirussus sp.]